MNKKVDFFPREIFAKNILMWAEWEKTIQNALLQPYSFRA